MSTRWTPAVCNRAHGAVVVASSAKLCGLFARVSLLDAVQSWFKNDW
jgi:hypothetical protein